MQHCVETMGKFIPRGHLIRDTGVTNLRFRADDALRDGAWGSEIRMRDLFRRQTANFAQRERDLCVGRKRWMAAGENKTKAIVLERLILERDWLDRCLEPPRELGNRRVETRAPPQDVDRLEATGRHQPRERVARQPVARPALDGGSERLVQRLLGEVEVADEADECGQDTARVRAVERLDRAGRRRIRQLNTSTGLTSMLPKRADGILDATCNASLRSRASIM